VLRFCSDIYTDSILKFAKAINPASPSIWKSQSPPITNKDNIDTNVITIPRKLEWNLTSDLSLALRFGETRLSDLISQNEFSVLEFSGYGSEGMKQMKCSPDAFVQMAFQASYYSLYGKVECTYEPAMTKQYLHGRTEAIRTVSLESNQFVRRFFEDASGVEKLELLKKACSKHSKTTRECSQGYGQDRHLYALFNIWKRYVVDQEISAGGDDDDDGDKSDSTLGKNNASTSEKFDPRELPSIFADSGWDKLNNSIISTSNCGNPSLRVFGFGPVTSNGFGIAYIIKENSLTVCVCSKHRQTQRFTDTLKKYLEEVYRIHNEVTESAKTKAAETQERGRLQHTRSGNLNYLLGGYGYFDLEDDEIKSRGNSPDRIGFRRTGISAKQLNEKLRLAEY
jgi:carnitine O-acetyltransferase